MFKKKITYAFLAAIAVVIFLILNRTGNEVTKEEVNAEVREYIDKPFANISIPRKYYTVNASAGAILMYATTKITIPQCAFVDSSGNVVEGNVKVSYREVNDPATMLVSGIPMAVAEDSSDYLQSAGMLEILAWQDGVPLQVNSECHISINKQSNIGDGDYNMYNLDTVNRRWDLKKENIPVQPIVVKVDKPVYKEPDYEALALKEGIIKPVKPVEKAKEKFQFKFKMDFSQNPEINIYDGVQWEFAGKKSKEDPAKNRWVLSATWNEMEIVKKYKNGTYKLKLISAGKVFKTTVKPVFDGDDMEYAEYVYNQKYVAYRKFEDKKKEEARIWRKKQEELAKAREKRKKTTELANKFYREFDIMGLGWVNLDKLYKEERQEVLATFEFRNGEPVSIEKIFIIPQDVNLVASFNIYQGSTSCWWPTGRRNQMILIDLDMNVYTLGPEAFKYISKSAKEHQFKIKGTGKKMKSMADIQRLMSTYEGFASM